MAESSRAQSLNLWTSQAVPRLASVTIGFGWDARTAGGAPIDLDASALGCDPDSRVLGDDWFVFFNNLTSPDGSITHRGTVAGDQDAARIDLTLSAMSGDVDRVVFAVSVYDAENTGQTIGEVRDLYIRVVNQVDGSELARFEPGDAAAGTAVVLGEICREAGEWKFRAIGEGHAAGLAGVARDFGVDV